MRRALILVLMSGVLAACIPDVMNTKPEVRGLEGAAPVQTLTDPASGTTTTLRPGGELRLKLDSNPTTGYFWTVRSVDEGLLEAVSADYFGDPAPAGMTGVGGHQMLVFKAVKAGRTELVLSYERRPEDVAETLRLPIVIRD